MESDKRAVAIDDVFAWDARRQELLTARQRQARALFIDVTAFGFTLRIFRSDAPKVFADLEASIGAELAEIEGKFAALGVTPTEWTAADGGESQ